MLPFTVLILSGTGLPSPGREIVKRIDMWGIDMLFVVGGNGGNAGANAINEMCQQHEVNCCVVGVPKSIDNDILLIDK